MYLPQLCLMNVRKKNGKYTFAGNRQGETFTPRSTFFGYRFLSITATAPVTIRSIRSVPVTSIAKDMETGHITTGHELVNRLIENTIWGQRFNYLSVPTDCPQRNERLGWADAGIIVPWTVWKQFADTEIIDENWQAMEKFIQHVAAVKYDHEALSSENGNYQWADWLSYEPLESCGGGAFKDGNPLPEAVNYWNYLSACYWAMDAEMMADNYLQEKARGYSQPESFTHGPSAQRMKWLKLGFTTGDMSRGRTFEMSDSEL